MQSEASALQWIQFTFWWSAIAEDQGETQANHRAKAVISAALERLAAKHFVDRQGGAMSPRLPCTVASRHTLSISTVEHLMRAFVPHLVQAGSRVDAAPPLDEEAFLYIVCGCQEFSKAIRMRQGDKKVLNLAMRSGKTRWRRPHNRVKDLCDKVFVLVQLLQSGHKLEQRDLALDAKLCMDVLHRVCKALMLMLASDLVQSSLVRQAHTLCRCAQMEQWPEDASPLKQCSGVTKRTLEKLREAGVHSFPQLLEHSASSLAAATGLTTQACAGILRPLGDLRPLSVTAVARKHDQGRGWDVVVQLHGKVPALCAAAESTAPAWQRGWHLWLCSATGRLVAHERIQRSFSAELTLTVSEEDVMDDLFVSLQHVWFLSMDEQTAVSMSATEAGPQSSSAKPASQGEAPPDLFCDPKSSGVPRRRGEKRRQTTISAFTEGVQRQAAVVPAKHPRRSAAAHSPPQSPRRNHPPGQGGATCAPDIAMGLQQYSYRASAPAPTALDVWDDLLH